MASTILLFCEQHSLFLLAVMFHKVMLTINLTAVLLALTSTTYGRILHAEPTSSSAQCPTYPCHNLSEYAQDYGQYFNSSTITLQFLPGNHTLDMNLDVANIQQLEILGNSNAPTQVMCGFAVGFSFANISKVRIDGIVFVSCAHPFNGYHFGLYFESVQTTEVSNCTFQDSYGTALGVVHSNLILKNVNRFLSY